MHRLPLRVAGIIFFIIAIMHLVRAILKIEVIVNGHSIPQWISLAGFAIVSVLSVWMFRSAR